MKLSYLIEGLEGVSLKDDCQVLGIAYDSREIRPGFLFVAVKGFKQDGHAFIDQASERGAAGVLAERSISVPKGMGLAVTQNSRHALSYISSRFCGAPDKKLLTVGITGTKGKTITCHMVRQVLEVLGYRTGLIGTVENLVGDESRPVKHTTPESLDLHSLLKEMYEKDCTAVAMEVSSHAISLDRVEHVSFDVAVFTNIGTDHLDFHRTLDDYVSAKGRLFESLGKSQKPEIIKSPIAVLNRNDPYCRYFESKTSAKIITYGLNDQADVWADDPSTDSKGSQFDFCFLGRRKRVSLKLPGKFNILNALAAGAVGLGLGMSFDDAASVLQLLKPVRGRAELVGGPTEYAVWVDYAHTPESLESILMTARDVAQNRVVAVFGCGGDRDRLKRPIMGRVAGKIADIVLITNDNPRTEEEDVILDDIEAGLAEAAKLNPRLVYERIADRQKAILRAISLAGKGDVIVLAGKGHETYQVFKDRTAHFDDVEEAKNAIAAVQGDHFSD